MAEHVKPRAFHIDFLERVEGNTYRLEGYYNDDFIPRKSSLIVKTRNVRLEPRVVGRPDLIKDVSVKATSGYELELDLKQYDEITFILVSDRGKETKLQIHTGQFTRMSPLFLAYRQDDGILFRNLRKRITVRPANAVRRTVYEAAYWLRLLFYWRIDNFKTAVKGVVHSSEQRSPKKIIFETVKPLLIIAESVALIPRAYLLRSAYFLKKMKKQRPIWIVSDRGMSAGDNGEALYRYIVENNVETSAEVYFVLSKKSKDYARLELLAGEMLLDQDSLRYKVLFLLADKIISSHADIEVTNPFLRQRYHFQDLINHQFIFLQHGVIRHDHSGWLSRFQKNIAMFVTSAQKEYDSILTYNYGYGSSNVVLTGLPRFDYLESEPQGKIILAPTYRRELARLPTNKNGARPYDPQFKNSQYFKAYSNVMHDSKLAAALKQANMTIELYLHPNLHAQAPDFIESSTAKVKAYPYSYKDAFRQGEILVSDYSSVSFDFAYLKKPLIYYQFDQSTFFQHSLSDSADFFSDEKDGFGPVITDHDVLIEELCKLIKSKKMDEIYQKRVDAFFFKIDKENSRRVYEAIIATNNTV